MLHHLELTPWAATITVTEYWIERWCRRWPCATLRGVERIEATFHREGLVDLAFQPAEPEWVESNELSALLADALEEAGLPVDHLCYYVAVGQFRGAS